MLSYVYGIYHAEKEKFYVVKHCDVIVYQSHSESRVVTGHYESKNDQVFFLYTHR
jgi:hypothetical protein